MTNEPMNAVPSRSFVKKRRGAKRLAWDCFFQSGNALLLIAATLIPIIFFMAGQGIYSMLYFAANDPEPWLANLMYAVEVLLIALPLPLIGGLLYIATGLAHGRSRQLRDVFYAYTSFRTYARTWIALLIPTLTLSAIGGVAAIILSAAEGLTEMAQFMDEGNALLYGNLFSSAGILLAVLVALIGLILAGYTVPFLWQVFSHPDEPIGLLFTRSLSMSHGHLIGWLVLHCSFLGWLFLSLATVGILLVLFVIPYYLLTVTVYADSLWNDSRDYDD